jgi:predicted DNA-binding ribbon-helix-helix protein
MDVRSGRIGQTEETIMQPVLVKRSIVIAGRKTSVSLEHDFWNGLKGIAREYKMTLSDLVGGIDARRPNTNLSSAIRIFVLHHFRSQVPQTTGDGVGAGGEMPPIARPAPMVAGQRTSW